MEYRREIDGLRALAVLPVILFHAGFQTFSGGFVGVDVFFVISGYLITSIILSELEQEKFSIINFYERRARRILPALFLVMFACLPFAWLLLAPGNMKEFSESVVSVNFFLSNILFWRVSGYFDTASELKPLLHTWSLAVEEQYYLLFPIFLAIFYRLGKRRIVLVLLALFAVSLMSAEWGSFNKPTAAFFLLPTRGFEIIIGALVAFYLNSVTSVRSSIQDSLIFRQWVSLAGLGLIIYAVFAFDKQTPFPSLLTLVPTVGTAIIILFSTSQTLVGKVLASKLFVGLGLISYSAYLWHQPIFAFARIAHGNQISRAWIFFAIFSTFFMAFLSWRYVEFPFRKRNFIPRKSLLVFVLLCSTFFILFGFIGSYTNGYLFRYKESDRYLAAINFNDEGKYNARRASELMLKSFDTNDSRRKILIIGDSFSQDLVNALYETGFQKTNQFSTRSISIGCGNLFISRDKFRDRVEKNCFKQIFGWGFEGLYEDDKLRKLMLIADEIWFASAWQYWQAELIRESVTNVARFSDKPVKVFGTKSFGNIDIKRLLMQSASERILSKGAVSSESIRTNELLKASLPTYIFIDIQYLLCGNEVDQCPLFDSEGHLKSYDGEHLTVYGARLYGEKLADGALRGYLDR